MDVFSALPGDWTFTRAFEPGLGTMVGTARFRPVAPDVLHYREDGVLELAGGHRGDAWREYRYVRDGAAIRICFVEAAAGADRVLHVLRPEGPEAVCTDVHLCGADTYAGRYRFPRPDAFNVEMTVTGPAKDYRTRTDYRRASG